MSDSNESPVSPNKSWDWGNSETSTSGYGQFNTGSWQNPSRPSPSGENIPNSSFSSSDSGASHPKAPSNPSVTPQTPSTDNNPYFNQYALNFQQVQPGIIPLRPLSLGEIFNGTFQAMRLAPSVMFGLILSIWAVLAIFSGLLISLSFPDLTLTEQQLNNSADGSAFVKILSDIMQGSLIALIPTALLQLIVSGVTTGIAVTAIAPMVLGRRLSVSETWQEAKPHMLVMVGWAFLYSFISLAIYTFAGSPLLMIIPGVLNSDTTMVLVSLLLTLATIFVAILIWAFIYVRLLFVYPAMVMENLSLSKAISRSWQLAKGSFWRLFGIMILALIIQNVILTGLSFVVQLITFGMEAVAVTTGGNGYGIVMGVTTALSSLIAGVFIPFFAGIQSLLYIDVRMRREGLALSLLRASQQD